MLTKKAVEFLCQLEEALAVDRLALESDGDEEENEEEKADHSVENAGIQGRGEAYEDSMKWALVMVEQSQQKRAFAA